MDIQINEMSIQDYDEVLALWRDSEGILLSDVDSFKSINVFLQRNPGLNFVAWDGDKLVGAVLCGYDGRRAYIDHLAVRLSHRRRGIGRSLVGRCMYALMQAGIRKCYIIVMEGNEAAIEFWKNIGWAQRVEMVTMSSQGVPVAR